MFSEVIKRVKLYNVSFGTQDKARMARVCQKLIFSHEDHLLESIGDEAKILVMKFVVLETNLIYHQRPKLHKVRREPSSAQLKVSTS